MVLNPRVDIDVKTAVSLSPNIGEAVGLIIGTAQYGPINKIITTSNLTSVLQIFKEDKDKNTTITKAAEIFYANGGGVLKIIRIDDGNAKKSAIKLDGSGPTSGVIEAQALYEGTYGDNIMVDIDTQGTGVIMKVKLGNITELFDNNGNANGYATNTLLADDVNSKSNIIKLVVHTPGSLVIDTVSWVHLEDGDNGNTAITSPNYTTVIDNIAINEDWDILMIPNTYQTITVEDKDTFHTTILGKINNRADSLKKYSLYVSGISLNEDIATIQSRLTTGERFVLVAPNMEYTSKIDGKQIILDGTYLACALGGKIASLDDTGGSATRKIANVNDLSVDDITGKKYYDNIEIEQILSSRVVPVSKIGNSLRYARAVTRINDTTNIFFEINILRIIDNLKTTIQNTLEDYIGEPNSVITRSRMEAVTDGVLEIALNKGLLNDYNSTIVTQGVTPDITNVAITVKPAYSTNFIDVMITIQ